MLTQIQDVGHWIVFLHEIAYSRRSGRVWRGIGRFLGRSRVEHFVVDAQPWARVGGYRVVVVAVVVVLLLRAVGSDGAVSICFKNRNRKRPKKTRSEDEINWTTRWIRTIVGGRPEEVSVNQLTQLCEASLTTANGSPMTSTFQRQQDNKSLQRISCAFTWDWVALRSCGAAWAFPRYWISLAIDRLLWRKQ